MEATCSSETSAGFKRTTRRYIPEDRTLHNHRSENLGSYIGEVFWNALYNKNTFNVTSVLLALLLSDCAVNGAVLCITKCAEGKNTRRCFILHLQTAGRLLLETVQQRCNEDTTLDINGLRFIDHLLRPHIF
jgi:hypothetical protein